MSGHAKLENIRQNYHEETEKGINEQINLELQAFYTYLSMASYFNRADVALPNFSSYFKKGADDKYHSAQTLIQHQNDRGGKVILTAIPAPERNEWGNGLQAIEAALAVERRVNRALHNVHTLADKHNDCQTSGFIEANFFKKATEKELTEHIYNLNRVGVTGIGEYQFEHLSIN